MTQNTNSIMEELKNEGYDPVYVWDAAAHEEDADHNHPFDTHLLILEGEIEIRMKGILSILKPGTSIDIPKEVTHYGKAGANGCKYIVAERH